jgi:cell division protein FtsB
MSIQVEQNMEEIKNLKAENKKLARRIALLSMGEVAKDEEK